MLRRRKKKKEREEKKKREREKKKNNKNKKKKKNKQEDRTCWTWCCIDSCVSNGLVRSNKAFRAEPAASSLQLQLPPSPFHSI